MSTTNFAGNINDRISSANKEKFTLDAAAVMDFINKVISAITVELSVLGVKAVITSQQTLGALKQMYFDVEGKLHKNNEFSSDNSAMTSIYETAYSLMTIEDYRSDAAKIIDKIKTDERFAYKFLYGTSIKQGKSIARLRSKILNQVRISYKVVIKPYDFNTLVYEHLFSEGTWNVLSSYNYRSTFFQWLSTVASRCIMDYLIKNGFIKTNPARTPGNTKLILDEMTPSYCHAVIDHMVMIPSVKQILIAVYVDRLEPAEIQARFDLNEKAYTDNLRAAEKTLKTVLLNSVHPYDDVLVDTNTRKVLVSSEFLDLIGQTSAAHTETSPLREVLGATPEDSDFELKVIDFLYDFSNSLRWNDEDTYVWQSRYIKNMAPESVAEDLNNMALMSGTEKVLMRDRGWVDTRYHRLNVRFETAIRNWWNELNQIR